MERVNGGLCLKLTTTIVGTGFINVLGFKKKTDCVGCY